LEYLALSSTIISTFHVGFVVGNLTPVPNQQAAQGRIDVFADPIQGAELALGQGGFEVLLGSWT
jgi:hypothetical protein